MALLYFILFLFVHFYGGNSYVFLVISKKNPYI